MGAYTTDARLAYNRALGFYCLTSIPGAVVVTLFNVYFLIYATDVLLVAPAVVGTLIAASRIYDGLSDIAIATWSDRTRSRWGRRRPFVIAGGVLAISYGGLWLPPENLSAAQTVIWLGVMLLLWETAWTMRTIGMYSLGIEVGQTPERRSWFIALVLLVGMPTGIAAHLLIQHLVDSADARAAGAPWFIGLGLVMAVLSLLLGPLLKELPTDQKTVERSFPQMLREVLSVGYHRQLIGVNFAESFAFSSLIFSIAYMLTYVLDASGMLAVISIAYLIVSQLSKIAWLKMIPRWGMRRIWIMGLKLWLVMFVLIPLVLVWGINFYLALAVLAGIAGGAAGVSYAMLGDISDYDARQSGRQRQGIYMSIYDLIGKIGGAATAFALGWLLQLAGFVPNEEQTDTVIAAIIASSSLLPFIGVWIGLRILKNYSFYETEGISDGRRQFRENTALGGAVTKPA